MSFLVALSSTLIAPPCVLCTSFESDIEVRLDAPVIRYSLRYSTAKDVSLTVSSSEIHQTAQYESTYLVSTIYLLTGLVSV